MVEDGIENLADQALAQFPVEAARRILLRRSDNLTWRVEEAGGRAYLLRAHRAVTTALAGSRQRPDMIRSELAWLSALGEAGLGVQRPLRSHAGEWVARVDLAGGPVFCTLLTWIEGQPFAPGAAVTPEQVPSYARLIAFLHDQAGRWTPPTWFARPAYDAASFERLFELLRRGLPAGTLDHADSAALDRVLERLPGDLITAQALPGQWGLIHADLHSGNLLAHHGDIFPIDFAMCGHGSFLFDLSVGLVAGVAVEQRGALLGAYRRLRPFPDAWLPHLDAYGLAGVLSYCAYQVGNPAQLEWLTARIPRLAANEFRRYLAGEAVYAG